jgi:lipopolysaccharide transport system permease protein
LAIIVGMIGTHFPDTRHLLEVGLQILFYLSPILYKPESLGERAPFVAFLEWNPVTSLLALIRSPILHGEAPPLFNVSIALGFGALCATLAIVVLRKLERNLIFWI